MKKIIKKTRILKKTISNECDVFDRLITEVYPNGIVSIVSDTFDLWKVLTEYLPKLKEKVLARDGKLVIRPDSGDPVDIICGLPESAYMMVGGVYYHSVDVVIVESFPEQYFVKEGTPPCNPNEIKGVIELLWETFGGTINEKGFKVLDPHIGAIYGDSITLERANQICKRLAEKGFASTNIVFGIGSYTYQYNTRDTFGFAMKATWCQVDGVGRNIFKNPITDDGTKKSAKGLVKVNRVNWEYVVQDECTPEEEKEGHLETVFENGKMVDVTTLQKIRTRVSKSLID